MINIDQTLSYLKSTIITMLTSGTNKDRINIETQKTTDFLILLIPNNWSCIAIRI